MPSLTLEYDFTVRKMSTAAFVYNFDSVYFSDFCSTLEIISYRSGKEYIAKWQQQQTQNYVKNSRQFVGIQHVQF